MEYEAAAVEGPPCVTFSKLFGNTCSFRLKMLAVTSDHSFLKLLQFAFGFPRAGKREGLSNAQKRACHDAWLKDKLEGVRLRCNHVSFPDLIPLSR